MSPEEAAARSRAAEGEVKVAKMNHHLSEVALQAAEAETRAAEAAYLAARVQARADDACQSIQVSTAKVNIIYGH